MFSPPTVNDNPAVPPGTTGLKRALFKFYGPFPRGRSVVRVAGVYSTVDYPDQTLIASASEVYLGGHIYTLTATQVSDLTAAGYAQYIS